MAVYISLQTFPLWFCPRAFFNTAPHTNCDNRTDSLETMPTHKADL